MENKLNQEKYLTILIPCLNEEKTIGICIEKCLKLIKKENLDAEILIVDNGCVDKSIEIAKKYDVRIIKANNKGYGNAIIYGTMNAIRKICYNG